MVPHRPDRTKTSPTRLHFSHGLLLRSSSGADLESGEGWIEGCRHRRHCGPLPLHGSLHHRVPSGRLGVPIRDPLSSSQAERQFHLHSSQLVMQLCDRRNDAERYSEYRLQVSRFSWKYSFALC